MSCQINVRTRRCDMVGKLSTRHKMTKKFTTICYIAASNNQQNPNYIVGYKRPRHNKTRAQLTCRLAHDLI